MIVWHWAMSAVVAAVAGFAVGWSAVIVYGGIGSMLALRALYVLLTVEFGEE